MVRNELEVVYGMLDRNAFERSELGLDYVRTEADVRRSERSWGSSVKKGGEIMFEIGLILIVIGLVCMITGRSK